MPAAWKFFDMQGRIPSYLKGCTKRFSSHWSRVTWHPWISVRAAMGGCDNPYPIGSNCQSTPVVIDDDQTGPTSPEPGPAIRSPDFHTSLVIAATYQGPGAFLHDTRDIAEIQVTLAPSNDETKPMVPHPDMSRSVAGTCRATPGEFPTTEEGFRVKTENMCVDT